MTKPQRNGSYASGYVYVYANDMPVVMPTITPTTTPYLVTPVATLTAMPMTMRTFGNAVEFLKNLNFFFTKI